jgi:hypothetical protein
MLTRKKMMREMIVTLAPFISIVLAGAVLVAASAKTGRPQ